jgi:phosphoglycolate phosphatase
MNAIFFDLDGTLVDSRADLALAVNLTRRDLGLAARSQAEVVACVGEGLRNLVRRAIPECDDARLDEAIECARGHYRDHLLDATVAYPTVPEALRRLRAGGWRLAVVTNKPRDATDAILAGLGLAPLLDAVVGGGEGAALKPDPAPVRLAAARLGVTGLAGSWIVGDHFTDLEVGRRLGLRRCFCRYGFGDPRDEAYDLAVDSLLEFADSRQ